MAGHDDFNFGYDLIVAEREFIEAVIYKRAGAAERCWQAIRFAMARLRIARADERWNGRN
jgi:hypothetical protein